MKDFNEIQFIMANESPLFLAIEREDEEIVKLLLARKEIDVNGLFILKQLFFSFYFNLYFTNDIFESIF